MDEAGTMCFEKAQSHHMSRRSASSTQQNVGYGVIAFLLAYFGKLTHPVNLPTWTCPACTWCWTNDTSHHCTGVHVELSMTRGMYWTLTKDKPWQVSLWFKTSLLVGQNLAANVASMSKKRGQPVCKTTCTTYSK